MEDNTVENEGGPQQQWLSLRMSLECSVGTTYFTSNDSFAFSSFLMKAQVECGDVE